jgi:hypothetical protein
MAGQRWQALGAETRILVSWKSCRSKYDGRCIDLRGMALAEIAHLPTKPHILQ